VARWALAQARGRVAFYDIDTPITLAALERGAPTYISRELIPQFDLYLSFTGGPILRRLESEYGARRARALYCSVDPEAYFPEPTAPSWDLGYLGTYACDRQPALQRLLLEPAGAWPEGRFIVAGPCYPDDIGWPANVHRCDHLAPAAHRSFYNQQRYTLNVTRAAMAASGYAPSVRLFEAAACATPIISDWWPGLDELLRPGEEILVATSAAQALEYLRGIPEERRRRLGENARQRILAAHTAAHRAAELERYVRECQAETLAVSR
jgi:spore maturation protein CgeB